MTFVPAPNVLQAELRFTLGTNKCENVLYFQGSAGVTPVLAQTLGNNLIGWWNTNIKPDSSNIASLNEVYITDLSNQTSFTVSVTTGLPSVGTNGGDAIPYNCAICISFRTGNRGRSGRGRNYVGGIPETQVSGSAIDAARLGRTVAAYQSLIGAGTFTPGLQWVVVSRFTNNAPRGVALVQPITTALSVDNIIDSQRRRLSGRGR